MDNFKPEVPTKDPEIRSACRPFNKYNFDPKNLHMKKLLIPVDFSEASVNAFHYGMALAKQLKLDVEVLHTYLPLANTDSLILPPDTSNKSQTEAFFFDHFKKDYGNPYVESGQMGDRQLTYSVSLGAITDILQSKSKDSDYAFIVMGTQGKHYLIDRLLGSVSANMVQKACCPVFVIPETVQFKEIDEIAYAVNEESAQLDAVRQVIAFSNFFNANIHFVNVNSDPGASNYIMDKILENIRNENNIVHFSLNNVIENKLVKGLNDFAEDNDSDLIVMHTRYKGLLNNLLNRSNTKKMALNLKLPLLVFHAAD